MIDVRANGWLTSTLEGYNMADKIDKILIEVGIDTRPIDKDKQELYAKMRQAVTKGTETSKIGEDAGRKTGQAFGRGMERSVNQYMRVIGSILGRYFGDWGRKAQGLLSNLAQINNLTGRRGMRGGAPGSGATGGITGKQIAGAVAAETAADVGLHAVIERRRMSQTKDLLLQQAKMITGGAPRVDVSASAPKLSSSQISALEKSAGKEAAKIGKDLYIIRNLTVGKWKTALTTYTAVKGASLVKSSAGLLAGLTAKVGLGAISAGVMAPVAGLLAVGASRGRARKQETKGFSNQSMVDDINKIKDPIERLSVILDKFGDDGEKVFAKMTEDSKKFSEKMANTKNWRAFQDTWGNVWDFFADKVKGGFSKAMNGVKTGINATKETVGKFFNYLASLSGNDVTVEEADARSQGLANIERMEAILKDKRKQRAEQFKKDEEDKKKAAEERLKEEKKLEEDIARLKDDHADAEFDRLDDLVKKEEILVSVIEKLKDKQKDFNRSQLEYWTIQKDLDSLERQRLGVAKERSSADADALKNQMDAAEAEADFQRKSSDRTKSTVDELAGLPGQDPQGRVLDPEFMRKKMLREMAGPWMGRPGGKMTEGEINIRKAQEIKAAEAAAKQAEALGMTDYSKQATDYALKLRKEIGALTSEEQDPMGFFKKWDTQGLLVRPAMGE